jgi:protein-disulfide isomerase
MRETGGLLAAAIGILATCAMCAMAALAVSAQELPVPSLGPSDARVTIVEFADFTSEASGRLTFMLEALSQLYPQDVRILFKHDPDPSRPDALQVHNAALAAQAQGRFWEMADVIFSNQEHLGRDDLIRMAAQLGLDPQRFAADLDARPYEAMITGDRQDAVSAGVHDGPGCVLNGVALAGPLTLQKLRAAIDKTLGTAG